MKFDFDLLVLGAGLIFGAFDDDLDFGFRLLRSDTADGPFMELRKDDRAARVL